MGNDVLLHFSRLRKLRGSAGDLRVQHSIAINSQRFKNGKGQLPRRLVICPPGWRRLSNPVGGSHPPGVGDYKRKKPVLSYRLLSEMMAVRGGLTRFARPAGSFLAGSSSVHPAGAGCRAPGRGFSSPLVWETIKEKSPYFRTGSYLK